MFPRDSKKPYYIYAPPYRSVSAGIKSLYLLCHHLNLKGESAYIYLDLSLKSNLNSYDSLFYNLNIKFLDNKVIRFHKDNDYDPIVIYSDTVDGNPINASNIVRYMMNYDGALKSISKIENELNFGYSQRISESLNMQKDRVLFIPVSDPGIFFPPKDGVKKEGSCVYLGKYRDYHGGKEEDLTKTLVKIGRVSGEDLSQNGVVKLLQESQFCYVYENTSIAIEAVLCGCAVVFIPNKFLKKDNVHLSRNEVGVDGFALDTSKKEISRAKDTVKKGRENYLGSMDLFQKQLDNFIEVVRETFSKKEKNEINEMGGIEVYLTSESLELVESQKEFDQRALHFRNNFPSNKCTQKVKLLSSDKRISLKTKIEIKEGNFGRRIRNILTKITSYD